MAVLLTLLALLLGLAVSTRLFPYAFRLLGSSIGDSIRSRTAHRRDILLSRAVAEEAGQNDTNTTAPIPPSPAVPASSSASTDSDWEKVSSNGTQTPKTPPSVPRSTYAGTIGFFHPFCNAGGGGERVLFAAILATQQRYPDALCVVYTGDHDASRDQILANARNRFNIHLQPSRVVFLYLTTREWILASKWPRFTLLGQSLGSLVLGWDAFNLLAPDILVDTMGYAFVLALSKWLFPSVPTAAYVHYPTISTDMLESLESDDNGKGLNAGSGKGFRGRAKQFYWQKFASLYSWVGGSVDIVMTNSTWTQAHISSLWSPSRSKQQRSPLPITVVYPPCAVAELQEKIPVTLENEKDRQPHILYIAQFRPEKMHTVIIDAFHKFIRTNHAATPAAQRPRLVLVGSVRDDHDEKRVYKLRLQAQEVKDSVDFVVNAKWPQILDFLKSSKVGVNGMWNEHFGIGVVEYQAAGLVAVVNDSGGPKVDIVVDVDGGKTGFHASTTDEFADGFAQALALKDEDAYEMRCRARKSSWRFSEEVFIEAWTKELVELVGLTGHEEVETSA